MESGSRCTRSQAAPDWTTGECITLVNEISAIEGEWKQSLASFQKWQLVVENCNSLLVVNNNNRSLNQCKKKWAELRADYNKVKPWKGSYWKFDGNKRKELGLPEGFEIELFKAIDKYVKKKGGDGETEGPETEPESDHEIRVNNANKFFWQTGPKKQRKKMVTRKRKIEESFQPWRPNGSINLKPQTSRLNKLPELPASNRASEAKFEPDGEDEKEKMMCAELLKNTELINAILQGNLAEDVDYKLADLKHAEVVQTDFTRLQGDKLIDCLGTIANALNQLCDLVQEYN